MSNKSASGEYFEIFDVAGSTIRRVRLKNSQSGLSGADLGGLAGPTAQLQGVDLSGANLYWASLGDADLSFANLSNVDLRGATLDGANCRGANFKGANLGRDNLTGRTSLKGADLSSAVNLDSASLTGAVYDDGTKFPAGFSPSRAGLVHVDDLPPSDASATPR
jgi:uncharacterized protein YjbI with pentapeptide repeats